MVRKVLNEVSTLAWTLGGVGLVLITMSGDTLKWGVWISAASLITHIIGVIVDKPDIED